MYDDLFTVSLHFLKLVDKCFINIKKKPSFQTSKMENKCFKIGCQFFSTGERVGGFWYHELFIMTIWKR